MSTLTQGFYSHSLVSQGICIDNFLALVFLGALVDTSTTLNNRSLVTTILLPHYTSPVWKIATKPEILQEFTTTRLGLTNTIVFQYDKHLPVCLTRSDVCDRFLWETDQYHKVQSVLHMRSGNRTSWNNSLISQTHRGKEFQLKPRLFTARMLLIPLLVMKPSVDFDQ